MISRCLFYVLCLAAAVVGFISLSKKPGGIEQSLVFPTASVSESFKSEGFTDMEFRRSFLEAVNALRGQEGYPAMTVDTAIDRWLSTGGAHLSCKNMKQTMASASLPGFRYVRAAGATGESLRGVFTNLVENLALAEHAKDDRLGLLLRALPDGQHEAIVVTGESIPEFSAARVGDLSTQAFVSQCVHCGKRSAFQNEASGATLVLTCPGCGLCSRLMGRDTKGRYHDAAAFLIPSPSPSTAPGTHPMDAMISIWQEAVRRCRYVEDGEANGAPADAWQTPRQTLSRGTGDCEDSALLLTDWMLANNIPARMALGTMNGGGHAWCIVKVEGTDYLLESTNRSPDLENLPAVNPDDGYVPSALFDRDALYVRAHPDKPFDSDYWSTVNWVRIPHQKGSITRSGDASKTADAGKR